MSDNTTIMTREKSFIITGVALRTAACGTNESGGAIGSLPLPEA